MISSWFHRARRALWIAALFMLLAAASFVRINGVGDTLSGSWDLVANDWKVSLAMGALLVLTWIVACRSHRSPHRWQKRVAWCWALGRCVYCHEHTPFHASHGDHGIAWSHGWWGLTSIFNLVNACPRCNMSKSARNMPSWMSHYASYHGHYPHVPLRYRLLGPHSRKTRKMLRRGYHG